MSFFVVAVEFVEEEKEKKKKKKKDRDIYFHERP